MTTVQQALINSDTYTEELQDPVYFTFYGPIAWTGSTGSYIWFNSPGSVEYSWTVPSNVSIIHAVCIANGGAADNTSNVANCWGGEGGAVAYGLSIPVTGGETLTLVVPPAQVGGNTTNVAAGSPPVPTSGGNYREWSYEAGIKRGSTYLLRAGATHYSQENSRQSSPSGTLHENGAISGTGLTGGGRGGWCTGTASNGDGYSTGPTRGCHAAGFSADSSEYGGSTIVKCQQTAVVAECAKGNGVNGTPPSPLDASFANETFVYCGDTSTSAGFEARTWTGGNGAGNYVHTYPHSSGGYASWATGGGGSSGRKHMDPSILWYGSSLDDYGFTTSTASYDKWGGGGGGHHCGTGCAYKTHVQYSGQPGMIRIAYQLPEYYTPTVNITTNIAANYSTTAGSGQNFTVAANDPANSHNSGTTFTYQWKYSTNGGSSWNDIGASEGGTSATLTRYATSYYSDNGHKLKCAVTGTNSVGADTEDTTICTLAVSRSWTESAEQTGSHNNFSASGLHPSGTNNDEQWNSHTPSYAGHVTWVQGSTNSFSAGARSGACNSGGFQMKLELRIQGSNGEVHGNEQEKSGTAGTGENFQFGWTGGNWNHDTDGTPTFGLWILDNGTHCSNGDENIFAKSWTDCDLSYKYKYRIYQNETRP